mmetsp:Transcript_55052/g.172617  ORF Transcript_55052/g.172617 Transcript_55052/m.172617 type:complete len:254 (+) Transcript_55052:344-1105(+)
MVAKNGPMSPAATILSCASTVETPWKTSPGNRAPRSVAIQPTVASMQTRPCLSSASRVRYTGRASVTWRGSKPFSPPTQPSSCSGYCRKGTESDIRGASAAWAQYEVPMQMGMSLMNQFTEGPHQPSDWRSAMGDFPNMPSWTMSPMIATIASLPLFLSAVCRRSSSSSPMPSRSSVPRPKSKEPMPSARGLTSTSWAPTKATSCTQPSRGMVDRAPRPLSKLSQPGKRKTSGSTYPMQAIMEIRPCLISTAV